MNRTVIILSAIFLTLGLISLFLKLYANLEIDWLWALAPLWLGLIVLFSAYILGAIGKSYTQIDKKEDEFISPKRDRDQIIQKAINEIKEAQEGKNPFNTNVDPVKKAIEMLKKEKEKKIEEKAEKLKRNLGKNDI